MWSRTNMSVRARRDEIRDSPYGEQPANNIIGLSLSHGGERFDDAASNCFLKIYTISM